jgi:hypothetical protein
LLNAHGICSIAVGGLVAYPLFTALDTHAQLRGGRLRTPLPLPFLKQVTVDDVVADYFSTAFRHRQEDGMLVSKLQLKVRGEHEGRAAVFA